MLTLAEILNKTNNGQEILEVAKKLGFQNIRLFNSFLENTLCLVVDFDIEKEKSSAFDHKAMLLELNIAGHLNCKVMVLQKYLMTADDKTNVAKNSVLLPTTLSQLTPIFGDPVQFKISAISEDIRYANDFKTHALVFAKHLAELNRTLSSATSGSSDKPTSMTTMASMQSSPSDGSYNTAKNAGAAPATSSFKPKV